MKVISIRTHKILPGKGNIFDVMDKHVKNIKENSILAVTSKIVSICEGSVVDRKSIKRSELAVQEADFYVEPEPGKRAMLMTMKDGILGFNSGVDSLNSNGYHVLWPKDAQKSANRIRKYLAEKFHLQNFGVIITDTRSEPLRRGASGMAIAGSGFSFVLNHRGKKDIFGKKLWLTESNVLDPLAAAAVLEMGECDEQTPMAMITDIPSVEFKKNNPSRKELSEFRVDMKDDYYKPLFEKVKWKKN